jgi:hypothetical protein
MTPTEFENVIPDLKITMICSVIIMRNNVDMCGAFGLCTTNLSCLY